MDHQENKMSQILDSKFIISEITAQQTYPLRMAVLRPGSPLEKCTYPEDFLISSFHLGIKDLTTDQIVSNGTFMINKTSFFPNEDKSYRLRGMATDPQFQGKNLGSFLLKTAEIKIQSMEYKLLWFNARESAFSFYKKNNYLEIGDLFDIEGIGPHKVMYKWLA